MTASTPAERGSAAPIPETTRRAGTLIPSVKRASALAHLIQSEIIQMGWPVGKMLGSEAELIERYGVSRSVLREAVRLLESRWVARMRPGPGGGLMITTPDSTAVMETTRLYLDYQGVQTLDLYNVWMALELSAITSLSNSIDEDGAERLRVLIAQEQTVLESDPGGAIDVWMERGLNLHTEIARQTNNPALVLFLSVVVDLALDHHTPLPEPVLAAKWLHASHSGIVEAIVSGDEGMAQLRLRRYMHGLIIGGGMGPLDPREGGGPEWPLDADGLHRSR
jgi:DNA-binding FadR family transcriptional regulator